MQIRKKQASDVSGGMESSHVIRCYFVEFRYGVSGVPERYLRFLLISAVDFYYVINKLIILVPDPH
jgi:hypothetical protein